MDINAVGVFWFPTSPHPYHCIVLNPFIVAPPVNKRHFATNNNIVRNVF